MSEYAVGAAAAVVTVLIVLVIITIVSWCEEDKEEQLKVEI